VVYIQLAMGRCSWVGFGSPKKQHKDSDTDVPCQRCYPSSSVAKDKIFDTTEELKDRRTTHEFLNFRLHRKREWGMLHSEAYEIIKKKNSFEEDEIH